MAVEELKGEYKQVGPTDASASSQVSYINTLIQQQQDVIVVSANDPNAVCPRSTRPAQAGIKVVTYDSDTAKDCRDLFINQATAEGIGRDAGQAWPPSRSAAQGEIAILSATPNATNQNAWIEVMKDGAGEAGVRQASKLVKVAYGNDDDQKSFQETQGLLQSLPEPQGHHLARPPSASRRPPAT